MLVPHFPARAPVLFFEAPPKEEETMTNNANAAPSYVEEAANYVFSRTLAANEALTRLPVLIAVDSDFLLTGIHGTKTGDYLINFRGAGGRSFCNAMIHDANLVGTSPSQPTPIGPAESYRAGSSGPMLDLTNLTGAPNNVEIVFSGIRRLRL